MSAGYSDSVLSFFFLFFNRPLQLRKIILIPYLNNVTSNPHIIQKVQIISNRPTYSLLLKITSRETITILSMMK